MNVGELIYYMRENRIHSAPILSKMIVENKNEDLASTPEQKSVFTPFGPARIIYGTCHGQVNSNEAFKSPEALFANLLKAGK